MLKQTTVLSVAAVLGLTAGCGNNQGKSPPVATPTASGLASPAAARHTILGIGASGELTMYTIASRSHLATVVRELQGPPAARVVAAGMSGESEPRICAIWQSADTSQLLCYGAGETSGNAVKQAIQDAPVAVAVSTSGDSVSWIPGTPDGISAPSGDVVVARLDTTGSTTAVRRLKAETGGTPDTVLGPSVDNVAFWGEDTLVLSVGVESDEATRLLTVSLQQAELKGWTSGSDVRPQGADLKAGLRTYEKAVTSVVDGYATAVQRNPDGEGDASSRAVVVNLLNGSVREVVAVAAVGRIVTSVSGASWGWVYRTDGGQARIYLRWRAERRGQRLEGLAPSTQEVIAQP